MIAALRTRAYSRILISSVVLILSVAQSNAASKDIAVIKKQYIEYRVGSAPSTGQVEKFLKSQKPDGTWPDIDYKNKNRSGWKTGNHIRRVEDLAEAYRKPGHKYAGSSKVKAAVAKAVKHWLDKDYKCPNWWYNNISAPRSMSNIMVLMGKDLPADLVKRIMSQIMPRSKIGMTGQNKVWLASNVFVQCLTSGDEKMLKRARDIILAEVRVTTKEGIQPDWSFHQHGPQQQFGNYGNAFGGSITQWGEILRGTSFALDKKQMSIIRNYILEGPTWILWKGRMDISGCGRQIYNGCQAGKGRGTIGQLKRLVLIDPANAKTYEARLKHNEGDGKNRLIGNKHFWRSDMMVHRRADWYASVKMSSRRVIGAETCNSENMRGMHLGDGVLYVYQTAKEYENIQPFWDWHRLPGTTCDQSIRKLVPGKRQCKLPTDFVGGVSDGQNGVAALDYKRDSLVAHKSWFFEDNAIICLGAGITASKGGTVLTSAQQSLLQGKVATSAGAVSDGKRQLKTGDWVHHAGIGYHILKGDKPTLQVTTQKGDWKQLFTTRGSSPKSGKVFSLWFDHGKTPKNQSYAYIMYPNSTTFDMPRLVKSDIQILSNTPDLQAIALSRKAKVRAVFYKPGKFEWTTGKVLQTDTPCIVSMDQQSKRIYVADPTQKKKVIKLSVAGQPVTVKLPTGGDAGKTVEIRLK